MRNVLFLLSLVFLLTACSNKPADVRQEVWDSTIQYTIFINKLVESGELYPEGLSAKVAGLSQIDDLNETEKEIISNVQDLMLSGFPIFISKAIGDSENGESFKEYNENYEKLKDIFGSSNLKTENLDEDFIISELTDQVIKDQIKKEEEFKEFMDEAGVTLTAKDVQFDMVNNLDEEFALVGVAELSDYYNYGFTNEKAYFVARVTPDNGSYSDSWYLYFNRVSFDALYNTLKKGEQRIRAIAVIPESAYKSGQGNMAVVKWAGIVQ
jgi:hypothetical protein